MSASVLPPTWKQVLAGIEQALEQTIALATQREQALGAGPAAGAWQGEWEASLGRLQERLAGLEARTGRTGQEGREIEAGLAAGAEELGRWLADAAAVRGRLAELAGRVV